MIKPELLKNLNLYVLEESEKLGKGLSKGSMFKLGYERFETLHSRSPDPDEKREIQGILQDSLNKTAHRQEWEALVKNKPFRRFSSGTLVLGRNVQYVDTRVALYSRQAKELWSLLAEHMDYRLKTPRYEGTEPQLKKTEALKLALYGILYRLEDQELKARIEKQCALWFPPTKDEMSAKLAINFTPVEKLEEVEVK